MAYILRSQLNQLIRAINELCPPGELFAFSADLSKNPLELQLPLVVSFRGSAFHFEIDTTPLSARFSLAWLPGIKTMQSRDSQVVAEWGDALKLFAQWLSHVKEEASQPDPWSLYTQGRGVVAGLPAGDWGTEKLNGEGVRKLERQTALLREFIISELNPTQQKLEEVDRKLDYMVESAQRLSKKDWANVALGVIFGIAVDLATDAAKAHALFTFVGDFIKMISHPLPP